MITQERYNELNKMERHYYELKLKTYRLETIIAKQVLANNEYTPTEQEIIRDIIKNESKYAA